MKNPTSKTYPILCVQILPPPFSVEFLRSSKKRLSVDYSLSVSFERYYSFSKVLMNSKAYFICSLSLRCALLWDKQVRSSANKIPLSLLKKNPYICNSNLVIQAHFLIGLLIPRLSDLLFQIYRK